ncbi:beta-1,3-mannanase [Fomitiporia mediterranea MF3/22]|uniref:beta-1,3-mannanase n=1 Tax=Fomitiporia mediterranea (strain MF3/22) TaxID=694068 RepID=UPI0004408D18|nr:beta-1,3-mannanase [Fomitiporia mediterranea MF3/22]EJD03939.1 beta-1,3-mannanase [Fomitiporia mediterranea MF3/22]
MKLHFGFSSLLATFACVSNIVHLTSAANSFAGSNLYYAAGLSSSDRETLLQGMQDAGMKVLRVWLDGQSTATTKGTTITAYPSLEPNQIGVFNDKVLELLDDFMIASHAHGIKLMISMHSFNALQGGDVYGATYGTGFFYEWQNATSQFDNRLRHVMNHVNPQLNKPWKQLSDYIFAFEAQNEAMIGKVSTISMQCDRANTIKSVLGDNSGILITTGGESFLDESVQPDWLTCDALDIVAIHAYGVGDFDTSKIQGVVSRAQAAGKKLIFQEWGSCYYTTENNNCPQGDVLDTATRNNNIKTWASQITAAGMPWMYWQVIPNADPHFGSDYEIGVNVDPSWDTLKQASLAALKAPAAFDYSAFLP